jgi:hypothetical protein
MGNSADEMIKDPVHFSNQGTFFSINKKSGILPCFEDYGRDIQTIKFFGQILRGYGESSGNIPGSGSCLSVPPAEFKEGNGTQTFLSGQKQSE